MKLPVYNLEGKIEGAIELNDSVFGAKVKAAVVHEVFTAQMGHEREPIAHTKTRGDVRGGGKKPWAQKGTGRARHGSIRSPIWKGGGVTFGPRNDRRYKNKINDRLRLLATIMCWSDKAANQAIYPITDFIFSEIKTKIFASFLKKLPLKQRSVLVVTPGKQETVLKMTRNLPFVVTRRAEDVTVKDLLQSSAVVASVAALQAAAKRLAK